LIFDQRRLETLGRIFQAGGVAQERVITQKRVVVGGVAPLLTNRSPLAAKTQSSQLGVKPQAKQTARANGERNL